MEENLKRVISAKLDSGLPCNICHRGFRNDGFSHVAEMNEGLGDDGGLGLPEPGTNLFTCLVRKSD